MTTINEMTDAAALAELGSRLGRLRLQRNLTQAQLAHTAGVSKRTLIRLEHGDSSQATYFIRVIRALGLLGNLDALVPPPLVSPLGQLRARSKERRRASPGARKGGPPAKWTWADESPKPRGEL